MLVRRWALRTFAALLLAMLPFSSVTFVSAQPAPPAVRMASSLAETYIQAFFAQDLGLFQKAGLNVDLQPLATGSTITTAVAGGSIDIGVANSINVANAVIRGVPFVVIAPAALTTTKNPGGLLCVSKASQFKAPRDFEGQTIAVPSVKSSADLAVMAWLTKASVDPAKVRFIEVAFSEMGVGLERGTYAGAILAEPTLNRALKTGNINCIADPFQAIAPQFVVAVWFTTAQFAQKNPDLVRRVAAVLLDAGKWANAHHAESAAIVSKYTKIDVDTVRNAVRPIYAEEMRLSEIQPMLDSAFKFGLLTRAVGASELVGR